MKTNDFFLKGKISFLLDTSFGSSAKGVLASFLIKNSNNCTFLMTSNSANASHTAISKEDNYNHVFKCLPTGSIYHKKLKAVYILPGASFEIKTLLHEIEMCGIPREKVKIHPRTAVIEQIDVDLEKGLCDIDGNYYDVDQKTDGTIKTGSTCSGSGAVLAKKVLRNKTLKTAKDFEEIKDMICVTELEILERLAKGESGFYEVGQGFPLSNNYHLFAPNTTSRNVTVSGALNDGMLPPSVVGNVLLNTRTFPIRIASKKYISVAETVEVYPKDYTGTKLAKYQDERLFEIKDFGDSGTAVFSKADVHLTQSEGDNNVVPHKVVESFSGNFYDDSTEIDWEKISLESGANKDLTERTTLTKMNRRVATFSKKNLIDAIRYNQTPHNVFISVSFANYVDWDMYGNREFLTDKFRKWLDDNIMPVKFAFDNVQLKYISTSEFTEDVLVVE